MDESKATIENPKKAKKKQKVFHDSQKAFDKSVHHIIETMRNTFVLANFPKLREKYKVTNFDFNKAKEFVVQRATRGWANRDTWGIDHWFASTMSVMLDYFADSTHGYSDEALELYRKCKVCDFLDSPNPDPRGEDEKLDDYKFRIYKFTIKRMAFLFREYSEETCSVQNKENYIHKAHSESVPGKPYSMWVDDCNEEEKAQNKKWMERELEVEKYRSDCLHRALNMLNIMIESLWD